MLLTALRAAADAGVIAKSVGQIPFNGTNKKGMRLHPF
jgi:hypothetical protein